MTTLITPLPTPPTRQDSSNFNDRADEFLGALPLFQQEANNLAVDVQAFADEVEIARQAAISTVNVTKWISGITYLEGAVVWSPINGVAYRKMTSTAGSTTDPSLDSVNYKSITDSNGVIYTPAGTGAVTTTVQQQLRNIQSWTVNVKDAPFYAKGDGVTDDTAAIQAALTAASRVYFPAGTYKCNISVPSNKSLVGEHKSTTILVANNTAQPIVLLDASSTSKAFINIFNFRILGSATYGIRFYSNAGGNARYCDNIHLENIDIYNGLTVAGLGIESRCIWSTFRNIEIRESPIGLFVETNGDVSQCLFEACRFAANSQWGVWFKNTGFLHQCNTFDTCNIENNNPSNSSSNGGMYIERVNVLNLENMYLEGNGSNAKAGIYINTDHPCTQLTIDTCMVQGSTNAIKSGGVAAARLMTGQIRNIRLGAETETITLNNDHPQNDVAIGSVYPLAEAQMNIYFGSNSGVISGYNESNGNSIFIKTPNTVDPVDLQKNINNVTFLIQGNNGSYTLPSVPFKNVKYGQKVVISVQNYGAFANNTVTLQHAPSTATPIESNLIADTTPGVRLKGAVNAVMAANSGAMLILQSDGRNLVEIGRSF